MAFPWIKVVHNSPDKPEVVQLADILGIDQDAAFGKCVRFWIWADQQSVDGNAINVTTAFLDRITNCPGFTAALLTVGWLESRNGRFLIPNFDRNNGQTAKSRALTRNRVKRSRNARVTLARDGPLISSSQKKDFKEEEIPGELKTPEFLSAWDLWIKYRREKKKSMTPRTRAAQLAMLQELGSDVAVRALQESIKNGWTGVFDPGPKSNGEPGGESFLDEMKRKGRL